MSFKSGRYIGTHGYVITKTSRPENRGWAREHVVVAEGVLGKRLSRQAVVHHVDGDKTNNSPSNLVICEDRAYHNLLEKRRRALRATGHANWRFCRYCREWDVPENLYVTPILGGQARHRECHRLAELTRRTRSALQSTAGGTPLP